MKIIKIIEILIYYDGVELFLAEDELDMKYICLHTESQELDTFLCAPISRRRLNEFYNGEIDLRSIYESPELNTLYTIKTDGLSEEEFELFLLNTGSVSEQWLPEPGFIFNKSISDETIVNEAIEKKRAIIHLSLNPPEARTESKIETEKLIEFLSAFQNILKFSYKKSIRYLNSNTRDMLDKNENFETEVFSFSNGSFTIHLQSKIVADALGYVDLVKALDKFDEIAIAMHNPEKMFDTLKNNQGHLINSYKKLLNLIIENDTPINYSWSYPEIKSFKMHNISKQNAIPIIDLLNQKKELEIEIVELEGRLIKADVNNGFWTLKSEETGKEHKGKIADQSGISLSGLILESQIYKFICEEKIEQEVMSGKEITTFWLQSYSKK
jgi:hypothetical protein